MDPENLKAGKEFAVSNLWEAEIDGDFDITAMLAKIPHYQVSFYKALCGCKRCKTFRCWFQRALLECRISDLVFVGFCIVPTILRGFKLQNSWRIMPLLFAIVPYNGFFLTWRIRAF